MDAREDYADRRTRIGDTPDDGPDFDDEEEASVFVDPPRPLRRGECISCGERRPIVERTGMCAECSEIAYQQYPETRP